MAIATVTSRSYRRQRVGRSTVSNASAANGRLIRPSDSPPAIACVTPYIVGLAAVVIAVMERQTRYRLLAGAAFAADAWRRPFDSSDRHGSESDYIRSHTCSCRRRFRRSYQSVIRVAIAAIKWPTRYRLLAAGMSRCYSVYSRFATRYRRTADALPIIPARDGSKSDYIRSHTCSCQQRVRRSYQSVVRRCCRCYRTPPIIPLPVGGNTSAVR